MTIAKKADFIIENKQPVYPNITTDGLALYYDAKGKENNHTNRENLVDMSGNGNHGELHNFAYENFSGYRDGLIFDGIDDKLVRPDLDIPEDNFTFQLNGNIISFSPDGTVKRVQDGEVITSKGFNLIRNGNFSNGQANWLKTQEIDFTVKNGIAEMKASNAVRYIYQNFPGINTHKYYMYAKVKLNGDETNTNIGVGIGIHATPGASRAKKDNNIQIMSHYTTVTLTTNLSFIIIDYNTQNWPLVKIYETAIIDLTETFGAGNEPTKEEMDAIVDRMGFIPNPKDILDRREYTHNFLGDMEGIIDDMDKDNVSGTEVFTDKADDSVVHVEIDGKSYQHAGSGKNLFVPVRLKTNHSIKENSKLINTIGSQIFYPIESPIGVYTASFSYQHNLNYAPIFMTFYYSDGSSDGNSHGYLDSTSQIRKEMTSNSAKKVVGVGYNAPTVIGVEWGTNPDPNMTRYGLALDTGVKTIGVSWDMESNPSMIRSGGLI